MKIRPTQAGYITALRFYKQANNTGHARRAPVDRGRPAAGRGDVRERDRLGLAGADTARRRARSRRTPRTSSRTTPPLRPLRVQPLATSRARWASGALTAPGDGNGVYQYGSTPDVPRRDLELDELLGRRDLRAPRRRRHARPEVTLGHARRRRDRPSPPSTEPTVTFDEPMTAATVTSQTVKLTNDLGNTVGATVAYDAPRPQTATLTPAAAARLAAARTRSPSSAARRRQGHGRQRPGRQPRVELQHARGLPVHGVPADRGPIGDADVRLARSRSA